MSNVFGRRIKLSIFGESHSAAIGITISGLPPGFEIDWERVSAEMARRAPGSSPLSTPRRERDNWEILSGVFENRTTGSPLSAIIRNENVRSGDYKPELMRPGHADLTAHYKYKGYADYRGGGHFSGRLTAPIVFAGAIAKQLLKTVGVNIHARIARIYGIEDAHLPAERFHELSSDFPVYDEIAAVSMKNAILKARDSKDSVGGIIECAALGVPAGWGDPFFDSLESVISAMMFSIPAIKGIEFGDGFDFASQTGYDSNDQMTAQNGKIRFSSNHNGGINGGISNGQPLLLRVAVKPTPTIGREQSTVDIFNKSTVMASFGGRHDPCIVPRAVPVIEAGLAICLLDFGVDSVIELRKDTNSDDFSN